MSTQVSINLSFNTSTGGYSLSTTDTSLIDISSGSYKLKGASSYIAPSLTTSSSKSITGYTLNSFTMPSGSTVGTNSPSSSYSASPYTSSSYTSSSVNYYTGNTSYSYSTKSISINSSTGTVSGDTDFFTYSTTTDTAYEYGLGNLTCWTSSFSYQGYTWNYDSSSDTYTTNAHGTVTSYTFVFRRKDSPIKTYKITATINTSTGVASFSPSYPSIDVQGIDDPDKISYKTYRFSSVTSESFVYDGGAWYSYGSATTSDLNASQQYRKSTTTYDPDLYIYFTFSPSTGNISWSYSGTYSSSLVSDVKNNSSFNISTNYKYTYSHSATNWNYTDKSISGWSIISTSKTQIVLEYNPITWIFIDKDGNKQTGDTIIYVDKNGNKTTIDSLKSN